MNATAISRTGAIGADTDDDFPSWPSTQRNVPLDAFAVVGYRMMCLRFMALNLRDVLDERLDIRNPALSWFDPIRGLQSSLSYDDCISLLGLSSRANRVREIALSQDSNKIKELVAALNKQHSQLQPDYDDREAVRNQIVIEPETQSELEKAFR